jgi:hypothetical protein
LYHLSKKMLLFLQNRKLTLSAAFTIAISLILLAGCASVPVEKDIRGFGWGYIESIDYSPQDRG